MMSLVFVLLMFVCLHSGQVSSAPEVQTSNIKVQYGDLVVLPCNGSAYLGEEGSVHWETSMGEEVATVRIGEERENTKLGVELRTDEQLSRGDWSLVLGAAMLRDSGAYQCIWEGQRQAIVSTVWLTVNDPPFEDNLVSYAGNTAILQCLLQISRSQTPGNLQSGWMRNGELLISTENEGVLFRDYPYRFQVHSTTLEEFHLVISPTLMDDEGEYRCWFKSGDSESPRPGLPGKIKLTVLQKPNEEEWEGVFNVTTLSPSEEEVMETTTSSADFPVFLEDFPQPTNATESEPMEAHQETVTSYPGEETTPDSLEWENLPWVRIGLIAGVLLVTALVLCFLKACQKI